MGAGRNVADVRLIPCRHTTDAEYLNKMPAKSLMLADKCPLASDNACGQMSESKSS